MRAISKTCDKALCILVGFPPLLHIKSPEKCIFALRGSLSSGSFSSWMVNFHISDQAKDVIVGLPDALILRSISALLVEASNPLNECWKIVRLYL